MKLTKRILFILILIFPQILSAQNSIKENDEEIFKTIVPRIGVGIHNALNFELGVSALYISNRALQWGAASL